VALCYTVTMFELMSRLPYKDFQAQSTDWWIHVNNF